MLTPKRFVSVSWYRDQESAQVELEKLQAAGLEPLLRGEYRRLDEPVEILVPEEDFGKARSILGLEGDASDDAEEASLPEAPSRKIPVCPECRSADTQPVPSYVGRAGLVSLAVLGLSALLRKPELGFGLVILAWCVGMALLGKHAGKQRCLRCGWEFRPENA
jgi:hypothetical protein